MVGGAFAGGAPAGGGGGPLRTTVAAGAEEPPMPLVERTPPDSPAPAVASPSTIMRVASAFACAWSSFSCFAVPRTYWAMVPPSGWVK